MEILLTQEGFAKLQDELEYLTTTRRQEIAQDIKNALGYGDISESSEYEVAIMERNRLEGRIQDLTDRLSKAVLADKNDTQDNVVSIGKKAELDIFGETMTVELVGSFETDIDENKITKESPLGSGIYGRKQGDIVEVSLQGGIETCEIKRVY